MGKKEDSLPPGQINPHSGVRKIFSEKLTKLMINHGYYPAKPKGKADASELAKAAGVSRQMAYNYLHGRALPGPEKKKKISTWLECQPRWLVEEDKENINLHTIDEELCKTIFDKMEQLFIDNCETHEDFTFLVDAFIKIYNYACKLGRDSPSKLQAAEQMVALLKRPSIGTRFKKS